MLTELAFTDLLTLFLLTCPTPPSSLPSSTDPVFWASLQKVTLVAELVGPKERWASDYSSELNWCRNYLAVLNELNAPSLVNSSRMPSPEYAVAMCKLNSDYRECLRLHLAGALHRGPAVEFMVEEAVYRGKIWEQVRWSGEGHWCSRRRALAELRQLCPDGFWTGNIPSPIPLEHLGER